MISSSEDVSIERIWFEWHLSSNRPNPELLAKFKQKNGQAASIALAGELCAADRRWGQNPPWPINSARPRQTRLPAGLQKLLAGLLIFFMISRLLSDVLSPELSTPPAVTQTLFTATPPARFLWRLPESGRQEGSFVAATCWFGLDLPQPTEAASSRVARYRGVLAGGLDEVEIQLFGDTLAIRGSDGAVRLVTLTTAQLDTLENLDLVPSATVCS